MAEGRKTTPSGLGRCRATFRESAKIIVVRRRINAFALAIAIYGLAAWAYVAAVAIVLPWTLPWRLTHFTSWPRTDTFGEMSFVASFVAFVIYRLTR